MDQAGRPIGFEIFPGNTFDGHTVVQSLDSLKAKFNINKLIFVGDRGICNRDNLRAIVKAGYEYIVGMPVKKEAQFVKEQALDLDSYESTAVAGFKEVLKYKTIDRICELQNKKNQEELTAVTETIVCTWTKSRANKDAHDREVLIEKAREVLSGKSKLRKPGKAKYLAVKEEVQYLDEAKIMEDEKWDGIYAIRTNSRLSKEEIYAQYHQLWKIEDCFRVMKSHLKIRPVYHWKPSRVTGHLVLCFLTFAFERHLEIELRKQNLQLSPAKIMEAISQMQASLVEINAREYLMRSKLETPAKQILKLLKITVPQDLSLVNQF
jgi:transposase